MFTRDYPSGLGAKLSQECKPDYEKMILEIRDKIAKNNKLRDALFDYLLPYREIDPKVAEMIGELAWEANVLHENLSKLIAQQEKDQD